MKQSGIGYQIIHLLLNDDEILNGQFYQKGNLMLHLFQITKINQFIYGCYPKLGSRNYQNYNYLEIEKIIHSNEIINIILDRFKHNLKINEFRNHLNNNIVDFVKQQKMGNVRCTAPAISNFVNDINEIKHINCDLLNHAKLINKLKLPNGLSPNHNLFQKNNCHDLIQQINELNKIDLIMIFQLAHQLSILFTMPHIKEQDDDLIYHYAWFEDICGVVHHTSHNENGKSKLTPIKIGRYLSNHFNLENRDIRYVTNEHKFQYGKLELKFVENHNDNDWVKIYNKIKSCMNWFIKSDEKDMHPARCYYTSSDYWSYDVIQNGNIVKQKLDEQGNGLRLAYIGSIDSPEARAIVNEKTKTFYSVYGDYILHKLLENHGYQKDPNYLKDILIATKNVHYKFNNDGETYRFLAPDIDGSCFYAELVNQDKMFKLTNDENARFKLRFAGMASDKLSKLNKSKT